MKNYIQNNCFFIKKYLVLLSILTLISCSKKEDESEISKKITITIGPESTTVLPRGLSNEFGFKTCIESGVAGPYVRYNTFGIEWKGSEKGNKLLPYILKIRIDDPRLESEYSQTLTATGTYSTLARIFGVTAIDPNTNALQDYISIGTFKNTNASPTCYPDFGGLPKPKDELSGSQTLQVPAKFKLTGVVEDDNGNQTPFTKEFTAYVTYFDGSVIDQ